MAFTKAYAKILAGMLEGKTLEAFTVLCGKKDHVGDIPEESLRELEALDLIRLDKDILSGKSLCLLTTRGEKVAEFVRESER